MLDHIVPVLQEHPLRVASQSRSTHLGGLQPERGSFPVCIAILHPL